MEDCLFCKFIKEHNSKVYEDNLFYIIKDINCIIWQYQKITLNIYHKCKVKTLKI